jgi:hypothetical protein
MNALFSSSLACCGCVWGSQLFVVREGREEDGSSERKPQRLSLKNGKKLG